MAYKALHTLRLLPFNSATLSWATFLLAHSASAIVASFLVHEHAWHFLFSKASVLAILCFLSLFFYIIDRIPPLSLFSSLCLNFPLSEMPFRTTLYKPESLVSESICLPTKLYFSSYQLLPLDIL